MMRINLLFGYCHSYASNRSNRATALYQKPLLLRHNPSNTCLRYSIPLPHEFLRVALKGYRPWAGRTSCSVGTTMLRYVLPSSTPWWTVARHWTLTRVNGWRMSCSGSPVTRIIAKPSVNSCPTSGLNKPTRINLNQLGAT